MRSITLPSPMPPLEIALDQNGIAHEHRNGTIPTFTGKRVCPLDLKVEDVCIEDVAHHLSLICRFTGATRRFYSVAEHSVRVSWIVQPEHALWGLLHDATEAYLNDMCSPLKRCSGMLGMLYQEYEASAQVVIAKKFGLPLPEPPEVKTADRIMLFTEFRDLLCRAPKVEDAYTPLPDVITPWCPEMAERMFLIRFEELTSAHS